MKGLKETLMKGARNGGICADGYAEMRGYDRDGLIEMYLRTIDWSLERNFPSLRLLRREFSDIEDKGVFVGKTFDGEVFDKKQVYVFHACKGTIKVAMDYDNAVIPMLYFANGCKMEVMCEQTNNPAIILRIPVVDDGRTELEAKDSEGCTFRRYVIEKLKKTQKITE